MKKGLRFWLGVTIITIGTSLPFVEKAVVPREPSVRTVLEIETPTPELIEAVKPLDEVITDKKDEESFSVFNNEFSSRVEGYETKGEIVLKVYASAIEKVFGKDLKEKYDSEVGLIVEEAMSEIIGDYDVVLTEEQRKELQEKFSAYSWILGGEEDE